MKSTRIKSLVLCFLVIVPVNSRAIGVADIMIPAIDFISYRPKVALSIGAVCFLLIIRSWVKGLLSCALRDACRENDTNKALWLLWWGADPKKTYFNYECRALASIYFGYFVYGSAIHYACHHGNKVLIDALLHYGDAINHMSGSCKITPLCFAAQSPSGLKVIDYIIRQGGMPCRLVSEYNSEHDLWTNDNFYKLLYGSMNSSEDLMAGDCEKTCRNIGLLGEFTQSDVSKVFRDVHHFISMVKHNKVFTQQPLPLLYGTERQLIKHFETNQLPGEIISTIMKMAYCYEDTAGQLVNKISFCGESCNDDQARQLKKQLKNKIIQDAHAKRDKIFMSLISSDSIPLAAI